MGALSIYIYMHINIIRIVCVYIYKWLCMISPPLVSNLWHPNFTKSTKVQPSQVAVGNSEASNIFWTKRSVPPSSPLGPWPQAPIRFQELQKKWWRTVRACHGFWWNHGHKHSPSMGNVEKSHLCQRIGLSLASFPLRQPLEYLGVSATTATKNCTWWIHPCTNLSYSWWFRNPAITSWVGSLSHHLQGFIHVRWCGISSIYSIFAGIKRRPIGLFPVPCWDWVFDWIKP